MRKELPLVSTFDQVRVIASFNDRKGRMESAIRMDRNNHDTGKQYNHSSFAALQVQCTVLIELCHHAVSFL